MATKIAEIYYKFDTKNSDKFKDCIKSNGTRDCEVEKKFERIRSPVHSSRTKRENFSRREKVIERLTS